MTRNELRDKVAELGGMTVREKDGEIRVNYAGGKEATAYYTNDRPDAWATAQELHRRRQLGPG